MQVHVAFHMGNTKPNEIVEKETDSFIYNQIIGPYIFAESTHQQTFIWICYAETFLFSQLDFQLWLCFMKPVLFFEA